MNLYPEFFNDVFGPIMQPGSSSHTAGPCRLGYLANSLLGEKPKKVEFIMDSEGSFAGTFGSMNEDGGMLGGALGMLPDDIGLFTAYEIAGKQGVEFSFTFQEMKESSHINAIKIIITGQSGKVAALVGDSTGGGMIETQWVNGFPLKVKGDCHVVLVFDQYGTFQQRTINSYFKDLLEEGCVEVEGKGWLHYFKVAGVPDLEAIRSVLPGVRVELLKAILPVITRPEKKPQLFDTMTQWRHIAQQDGLSLSEVAIRYEMDASLWSREKVIEYMKRIERKMYRQTHALYEEDVAVDNDPFTPRDDLKWSQYQNTGRVLSGSVLAQAIRWAYGAGTKIPGVEIVPGPMGTGGGYIYSALRAVKDFQGFTDEDLLRGLFIAAGVGAIAYTHTSPTGEVIGCAGECGVCSAMAAAAITEMAGGTPEQVENSASLALQASIGIPCDPIPGGLRQPCFSRTMMAVNMAIVYSDLALAGKAALLPFHEALYAADLVGRGMKPELLCTSRGGCCAAPSAKKQAAEYNRWYKESKQQAVN